MSALPIQLASAYRIDWSQWVPIREAATALRVDEGRLRHKCKELEVRGQAMKVPPPDGGPSRWWVHRDHDARLRPRLAEDQGDEASLYLRFPRAKVERAMQQRRCVERLREARADRARYPGLQAQWLPRLIGELSREHPTLRISKSTLHRWEKDFKAAGLRGLIDGRGGDQVSGAGGTDPKCWAYFESIYLVPSAPYAAECWRQTRTWAKQQGLRWCELRTCQAQLNDRIPPEKQAFHRDKAQWRSRYMPTLEQTPDRFEAGRAWVMDHTQLDFFCRIGRRVFRPFITTAMDWRTRKVVGHVLCVLPNSDTIGAAFRQGMHDESNMGGPAHMLVDNGKDFDAWMWDATTKDMRLRKGVLGAGYLPEDTFRGIFGELGITPHFSIPHSPNGKSPMERWYGTLHGQFCRSFPTYCGKDTASKPDGLAKRLADLAKVPTFDEVRTRVANFIEAYNRNDDHQSAIVEEDGLKLSPAEAMARWCATRRVFKRAVLDLLLMHWERPVTVGKQGVSINLWGVRLRYGQHDPALTELKGTGRRVLVAFDPHDVRRVQVWQETPRVFLTVAHENVIGGFDGEVGRERIAEFRRNDKLYRRALRTVADAGPRQFLTSAEQLLLMNELPEPEPNREASLMPVRTAFDDQVRAVARAEFKQAAGAETAGKPAPPPRFSINDWARPEVPAPIAPARAGLASGGGGGDEGTVGRISPAEIDVVDLDDPDDDEAEPSNPWAHWTGGPR